MKTSLITLSLLVACTFATMAQKGAQITFKEMVYDYGTLPEETGKASCTFAFTNTGDAPLIITRATASCGCTQPDYPKAPVAAGNSGEIKVTYNTIGRPGSFSKNVYIYSNADPEKTTLTIKGSVTPRDQNEKKKNNFFADFSGLQLTATHLTFSDVYIGKIKTMRIELLNGAKAAITPQALKVPRHLKVTFEPTTLMPEKKGVMIVEYQASAAKDWGLRRDEFFIKVNDDNNFMKNKITVSADIREDYASLTMEDLEKAPVLYFEKNIIDFGTIDGNKTATQVMRLENKGKSNLQIRKIKNDNNDISATVNRMSIPPGKAVNLTIKVDPTRMRSNFISQRIFIITNDPQLPSFSLRILGTVK